MAKHKSTSNDISNDVIEHEVEKVRKIKEEHSKYNANSYGIFLSSDIVKAVAEKLETEAFETHIHETETSESYLHIKW